MSLSYGSAKLNGFLWKDYTCLQPLDLKGDRNSQLTNATYLADIVNKDSPHYNNNKEKDFLQEAYAF